MFKLRIAIISVCFFCGLVFGPSSLMAQSGEVIGVVSNDHDEALPYAEVKLKGTSIGASTDEEGHFRISHVPVGQHTVIITSLGYERVSRSINVSEAGSFDLGHILLGAHALSLEEVVISGSMKPMSRLESAVPVEVYSPKFFKKNPNPSVFESLQNVNGVRPQLNCNVCNTGDIHINGLEGPYTMILIDGMPIVSGLSTVYGLTGIPQSMIERIEVVKGPASTLYGSEAVGGLINVITKNADNAPVLSADVFTTSWAEVNVDVGSKFELGDRVQGLTGINYFNYQLPIDNNGDGFTDLTLQDRVSFFQKFNFKRKSKKAFTLAGRYVYEDRWGGEMDWNADYRGGDQVYGESIYTSRWEALGVYEFATREDLTLQFSANGHQQNSVYGNTVYNADQYVGFGQLTWRKKRERHDLLGGVVYRYTYYDDDTPATFDSPSAQNQASITHLPGVFIQDEVQLSETQKLLLGVRYDFNSLHGSIVTPRANYKWNSFDKKNTLRLSVGNGYRVANIFTEDHAALTGARTVEFIGNLSPETSWNGNVNYVRRWYPGQNTIVNLDATAFYTYFTNRIVPDYETDPNKIIYSNLNGHSISQGASLNLDVTTTSGLTVLAGATVLDVFVVEEDVRKRQILTESFQGVWSVSYTIERLGLTADYTGNLFGPMRLPLLGPLDPRDEYSPWYSLQNIQLTKAFGQQWEVYGGVKNLLNFTPPANSIARAFDPFDRGVDFASDGSVIPTQSNPYALTFDPSYVYAPNQGIRGFLGVRWNLQ